MTVGIYRIRHLDSDRSYYGRSRNVEYRWSGEHLPWLRKGIHYNSHLQNAFNKYGEGAFVLEILEECDLSILKVREKVYLDQVVDWNFDYHIGRNPEGGSTRPVSDGTRKKMSDSQKRAGNRPPDSTGRVGAMRGKTHSIQTREKVSVTQKGKGNRPPSRRGKKQSEDHRRKRVESSRITRQFLKALDRLFGGL